MTILLTLVMNSLHKYYCDIAVIMTGFGFTKLTAHFLRYLDSQKKSEFQGIPNFKGSEFEEIKCNKKNVTSKYISKTAYQKFSLKKHNFLRNKVKNTWFVPF